MVFNNTKGSSNLSDELGSAARYALDNTLHGNIIWVVILIMSGLIGQFGTPGLGHYASGICSIRIFSSPVYVIITILSAMISLVFLIIQIVMAIITFVYIKKHTIEGNVQIKKAVTKVLMYLVIASSFSFISSIVPAVSFVMRLVIPDYAMYYKYM